jgi:Rps23 Pro-64 3,4-dihydroxylase Tpa1-like proline 4-hydroxylase
VLGPADRAAILDGAFANAAHLTRSTVGGQIEGEIAPGTRNSASMDRAIEPPWKPILGMRVAALLPGLFAELGIDPVPSPGIEFEMVVYNDGGFYARHVDVVTGEDHLAHTTDRVLTAVYYFHAEPKGYSGGALRLHPIEVTDNSAHADIEPEQNMVLAFPSWARHEVLPVRCPSRLLVASRFAINCWVHRQRPGTAAPGVRPDQ